jgi:hypothetical protein
MDGRQSISHLKFVILEVTNLYTDTILDEATASPSSSPNGPELALAT